MLFEDDGRYRRQQKTFTPAHVSHVDTEVLRLDIYGLRDEDMAKCKTELESKLNKAVHTLLWKSKPSYEDDRAYICKLTPAQVSIMCMGVM